VRKTVLVLNLSFSIFGFSSAACAGSQLFVLDRSTNRNEVIYEANVNEQGFDSQNPIYAYWKMNEKSGSREELSGIEKSEAYGIKTLEIKSRQVKFTLSAMPKMIITAKVSAGKKSTPRAYMNLLGKDVELKTFFLHVENGGLLPRLKVVEIAGRLKKQDVKYRLFVQKDDNFRIEDANAAVLGVAPKAGL
jgi:hypothetical protein